VALVDLTGRDPDAAAQEIAGMMGP
jgi:hypothetical protein